MARIKSDEQKTSFDNWLRWARRYADSLDPLVPDKEIVDRLTQIPEKGAPTNGIRDVLKRIEHEIDTMSTSVLSLDYRSW